MTHVTTNPPIDPVDAILPAPRLFALGLQHVLVMYAGAIAVPLIVGTNSDEASFAKAIYQTTKSRQRAARRALPARPQLRALEAGRPGVVDPVAARGQPVQQRPCALDRLGNGVGVAQGIVGRRMGAGAMAGAQERAEITGIFDKHKVGFGHAALQEGPRDDAGSRPQFKHDLSRLQRTGRHRAGHCGA